MQLCLEVLSWGRRVEGGQVRGKGHPNKARIEMSCEVTSQARLFKHIWSSYGVRETLKTWTILTLLYARKTQHLDVETSNAKSKSSSKASRCLERLSNLGEPY